MTSTLSSTQPWFLYVVECANGAFYTGISTNVTRRVQEHNAGRGARYTASRRPVVLRASWRFPDRRSAMQAEAAFKRKDRSAKERAINEGGDYREGRWSVNGTE
jgi:putative endonuclease